MKRIDAVAIVNKIKAVVSKATEINFAAKLKEFMFIVAAHKLMLRSTGEKLVLIKATIMKKIKKVKLRRRVLCWYRVSFIRKSTTSEGLKLLE